MSSAPPLPSSARPPAVGGLSVDPCRGVMPPPVAALIAQGIREGLGLPPGDAARAMTPGIIRGADGATLWYLRLVDRAITEEATDPDRAWWLDRRTRPPLPPHARPVLARELALHVVARWVIALEPVTLPSIPAGPPEAVDAALLRVLAGLGPLGPGSSAPLLGTFHRFQTNDGAPHGEPDYPGPFSRHQIVAALLEAANGEAGFHTPWPALGRAVGYTIADVARATNTDALTGTPAQRAARALLRRAARAAHHPASADRSIGDLLRPADVEALACAPRAEVRELALRLLPQLTPPPTTLPDGTTSRRANASSPATTPRCR